MVACQQILDRMEAIFPSVKKPTEDLVGPVADRALMAAESYLEYFLPDTKPAIVCLMLISQLRSSGFL